VSDEFRTIAKWGNEIERSTGVKLHGTVAFDVYRISHIEARESCTLTLFDV